MKGCARQNGQVASTPRVSPVWERDQGGSTRLVVLFLFPTNEYYYVLGQRGMIEVGMVVFY